MTVVPKAPRPLEFWFEFGSSYSYLSVMRIEALAARRGVDVVWKPFLLGPIFRDFGWQSSPFVLQKEKGEYVWRDLARRARKYDLEFRRPTSFPRTAVLPMRVAMLGAGQPWCSAFCRRVMRQNWVLDMEIDNKESVLAALAGIVPDPAGILGAALEDENKLRLRRQTEEARRRGIFGAPSFFVGDEMFWGDDRLDDALDAASA